MTSQRQSGTSSFYGPDSQSSNRILVSLGGAITDNYILKSFGEEYGVTGSTTNPYRYIGMFGYRRDMANRQYIRDRYLDIATGRWISRDPIGFAGGDWNLYRYVGNEPNNTTDPSGQSCTNKEYEDGCRNLCTKTLDTKYIGCGEIHIGDECVIVACTCGYPCREAAVGLRTTYPVALHIIQQDAKRRTLMLGDRIYANAKECGQIPGNRLSKYYSTGSHYEFPCYHSVKGKRGRRIPGSVATILCCQCWDGPNDVNGHEVCRPSGCHK